MGNRICGVGNAQATDMDVRHRQQTDVDFAADAHFTPRETRGFFFDGAPIAIPIDQDGGDKQCRKRRNDEDAENDQTAPHDRLMISLCIEVRPAP